MSSFITELVYTAVIVLSCMIMWLRTQRIYELSGHLGIKYFRLSMLFFGLAFLSRFGLSVVNLYSLPHDYTVLLNVAFTYCLMAASLFLVFSLTWKRFERFGVVEGTLFVAAFVIALIEFVWIPNLIFPLQLGIVGYAIAITYRNYLDSRGQKGAGMRQLYFAALVIAFLGYLFNFLVIYIAPYFPWVLYYVDSITVVLFLILLYGVLKVTRDG